MRIAFLGTADFAVPSLRACARRTEVAAVVTQPDRPGSRGRPAPRPVADAARELGLEVWQPERVRDPAQTEALLGLGVDALVVAAFGQILPQPLLHGPPLGGVNVHASLLPRWRGAAPVAAAILAGDAQTGVSIMRMEAAVDAGPVYAQRAVPLAPDATTPEVTAQLASLGAELLVDVLAALERGEASGIAQDEATATHAPRLRREDSLVDWSERTAVEVDRRVRALRPWPGVVAPLDGEEVRILSGGPEAAGEGPDGAARPEPGTVAAVRGESVLVAAREGLYRIDAVHPPGRRPMPAAAYLRGRRR